MGTGAVTAIEYRRFDPDCAISQSCYPEGKEPKGFMATNMNGGFVVEHNNVSSFAASHV